MLVRLAGGLGDELLATIDNTVTGVVQGVGFRPWVARLARRLGVRGCVRVRPAASLKVWNGS